MSKRLQVLLREEEYRELEAIARRRRMSISEWARQALRAARHRETLGDVERKLAVVREGSRHAYPSADIDQMLTEIERGYTEDPA
jgi:predicted 2-oxoglutarate/Fe(II)-dependent dioxygenase YbiX